MRKISNDEFIGILENQMKTKATLVTLTGTINTTMDIYNFDYFITENQFLFVSRNERNERTEISIDCGMVSTKRYDDENNELLIELADFETIKIQLL